MADWVTAIAELGEGLTSFVNDRGPIRRRRKTSATSPSATDRDGGSDVDVSSDDDGRDGRDRQ